MTRPTALAAPPVLALAWRPPADRPTDARDRGDRPGAPRVVIPTPASE